MSYAFQRCYLAGVKSIRGSDVWPSALTGLRRCGAVCRFFNGDGSGEVFPFENLGFGAPVIRMECVGILDIFLRVCTDAGKAE